MEVYKYKCKSTCIIQKWTTSSLQQTEKLSKKKKKKKSVLACKLDNFQFLPVTAIYIKFEDVLYICHKSKIKI